MPRRLFVAVDVPVELASPIAAVQSKLPDSNGLRRTDPERAHVTLKFLGAVSEARVASLRTAVRAGVFGAGTPPFEATVGGFGVFPSLDSIAVVWAGFQSGDDAFRRLHESIERETVDAGFPPAEEELTPHVTLARIDDAGGQAAVQRTVRTADPDVGSFRVESVDLVESTLTDDGPVYETVARFDLPSAEVEPP